MLLGNREQKELTNYLKLNNVAFSEWKSGKSKSYRKYLIEIAEFFDVSIDYLVYGKEKSSPAEQLTDDEQELLTYYKELDLMKKGQVLERAKVLFEQSKIPLKELENSVFIEYYSLPVSAGTGVDLDGCEKGMLEVKKTQLTLEANFALRVSGNSMEPVFHDGDVVLIASQPSVEIGEIGIFISYSSNNLSPAIDTIIIMQRNIIIIRVKGNQAISAELLYKSFPVKYKNMKLSNLCLIFRL